MWFLCYRITCLWSLLGLLAKIRITCLWLGNKGGGGRYLCQTLYLLILTIALQLDCIIPILQIRKCKSSGVLKFVQGCSLGKWWSQEPNPVLSDSKASVLFIPGQVCFIYKLIPKISMTERLVYSLAIRSLDCTGSGYWIGPFTGQSMRFTKSQVTIFNIF